LEILSDKIKAISGGRKSFLKKIAVIAFVILAFGYYADLTWRMQKIVWEFDSLLHFVGGFAAGCFGVIFASGFSGKRNILFFISFVLAVGVLWEIMELYYLNMEFRALYTSVDLVMDVLGGTAAVLIALKKNKTT
jgi:VanZ family protein